MEMQPQIHKKHDKLNLMLNLHLLNLLCCESKNARNSHSTTSLEFVNKALR